MPRIAFSYTLDDTASGKDLEVSTFEYNEQSEKTVHTPVISYSQNFPDFLFGSLNADLLCSMVFSDNSTARCSDTLSGSALSSYVSLKDSEKKQKSSAIMKLNYSNGVFFLKQTLDIFSEEVVESMGSTVLDANGIRDEFTGGYHFPFDSCTDMKYLQRGKAGTLTAGLLWSDYVRPEYSAMLSYRENSFNDYESETEGFSRSRAARSYLSSGIKIPLLLRKTELFSMVRHLQVNYTRSLAFNEEDVPFEGEGADPFTEEYGISRVMSGLGNCAFNIFSYYPGCFFSGRGNYGMGRDFIYDSMNEGIGGSSGSLGDYNNSLKLTDRFTADFSAGSDYVDFSLSASLNQVCERSNVYGIPNQVITTRCGLSFDFNLMNIFDFWFFRENREGLPYHASVLQAGTDFSRSDMITCNIRETSVAPFLGATFRRDRTSLSIRTTVDIRHREDELFINPSLTEGARDYVYIANIEGSAGFMEEDTGYTLSLAFETDVKWMYDIFARFHTLSAMPVFNLAYRLELDRYDYMNSVSPEPYDLHFIESSLTLDLHKNIRGGLNAKGALEKYRNRETGAISREVVSYEISGNISLVF